ncbi:hypothetical protein A9Q84_05830 [Halobacteriovorax marinus]|uniref:DNA 3'-5' helicase n=1 Tax=Halobacteriovorax marinus TaxID=97084 RepID=A0A1Y5FB53_9BACT|nr:hypothetical protein A9Q84_05830 [Halobacteriovorax marinus]
MRAPNPEQKLAIEHTGGVLLSAGAGSGKTFVLVEHVLYLSNKFIEKNRDLNLLAFESQIQSYFTKIVLMTFTKKAAGEIYERLVARIEAQIDMAEVHDLPKWVIVKEAIDYMTISTIHGFCYKLIGQGLIPGVSSTVAIISESESRERITKLYERWFENHLHELPSEEFAKIISLNSKQIIKSMMNIFGSPEIRLQWKTMNFEGMKNELNSTWDKIWALLDVDFLWKTPVNLAPHREFSDKPWYQIIDRIQKNCSSETSWNEETFNALSSAFDGISRLTGPSKKIEDTALFEHFAAIKELRTFLKKYSEDIVETYKGLDKEVKGWWESTYMIFEYIEEHYRDITGFTFSDLEYYVLGALKNDDARDAIASNYHYFIVDEFQDTSEIQFEMLERIISGDFNKLFTVGDMKQAIYGFRGGELGVFKECMVKTPTTLKLNNNYRSNYNVIDFNNYVFDYLFKLGSNFEGIDHHRVPVDYQTFPFERSSDNAGAIKISNFDITSLMEEGAKPKTDDFSFFESSAIIYQIEKILSSAPDEDICILYKNLGPSKYLINELIKRNIGFTAQVKVPLAEDPILGIFNSLVEYLLSSKSERELSNLIFHLEGYFNLLNVNSSSSLEISIVQYEKDILNLGVHNSFLKFLFSRGLLNSNHKNNGQIVKELCEMCGDDIETIYIKLNGYSDVKYSIDFEYGRDTKRIQIMTTHASKGLEFDNVFLGGIHNNGFIMPEMNMFGKLPWSFKWKKDSWQKSPFTTPMFIYEGLLSRKKDFAESKRLFYVACTRAKKNLQWIDLSFDTKPLSSSKNSWICGLRKWQENDLLSKVDFMEEIKKEQDVISDIDVEFVKLKSPLFHTDSLGIASSLEGEREMGIISELSVTRLASISQCPRKFYLLNVCKFTDEDVEDLTGVAPLSNGVKKTEIIEEENVKIVSSAQRGTDIHEALSFAIKRNWVAPAKFLDSAKKKDLEAFDWTIEELKKYQASHEFISEEMVKFPFFGQMISGTPDLVLVPKVGGALEIWDYKTGQREESKEVPYWFQLKAYAYAYQVLYPEYQNFDVKLILSFVDMKENVIKTFSHENLINELGDSWKLTSKPDLTNQEHCEKCTFGNLCHF